MICEGNMVQVMMGVVRIKCPPAATARLHAGNPVSRSAKVGLKRRIARLQEGMGDHRRVIDIGVVGVLELKGPAAAFKVRPLHAPVSRFIR